MANTTTSKKKNTATGKKRTILSSIKDVYHSMMKNDELILSKVTLPLKDVMTWGKITKEQACLFSYFATLGINGEVWFDLGDVQNYIDCEWIDYCENIPDMDVLLSRGFFGLRYDFPYVKGSFNKSTQFYLPDCIEDILSYNKKFAPYEAKQNLKSDTLSFLYRCKQENFNKKRNYYVDSIQSFYSDNKFLAQFTDFANNPFEGEALGIERSLLFFVFAGTHLLEGDSSISVKGVLSNIEDNDPNWLLGVLKSFKEEKNWFIKKGIFEIDKSNLGDDIAIRWGEKARKEIFNGDAELLLTTSQSTQELGKIKSKDIKEKTLFYNENNVEDVKRLEDLLSDKKYNEIRERLDKKAMPKGVIVLMHGAPGTGKTETVMQIAKKVGRDILHVNIQEIRSCWVGESEKNTKKIFEAYRSAKGKKPILLFNEADAIVSKRTKDVSGRNSSVNKMENAMQNIILEEFENFDGICVLTTNLADTLDEAFDRRILFKMKFENPTKDVKKKIWKNKVDSLTDEELDKVSEFDFSGGQIENIRRKITIDEVLYGKKPSLDSIVDFCKKEKLQKNESKHIGFSCD